MKFLSERDEAAIRDVLIWFRSNRTNLTSRAPVNPRPVPVQFLLLAQAPEGGVPAREGATPGEATVTAIVSATNSTFEYNVGDLVKTALTFTARNWTHTILGDTGDRVIHVEGHYDGALVLGADECDNDGDPDAIKTQAGG